MQVIDEQIAGLQARITSSTTQPAASEGGKALGASITRFDQIELERKVAEKQYTEALTALERARMNAGRQTMYLATFVQPILPQEHSWPYRIWFSLIGAVLAVGATVGTRALLGMVGRRRP
jgi:capsular polysaccharide transport system permease protein